VDKYAGPGKPDLVGWVKYGTGLFNILVSQLPPAVMVFADFARVTGERDRGLTLLTECQQGQSFTAPFAALLMLAYYLVVAPLTGDQVPGGLAHSKKLIEWGHVHFPGGAFFALMESRYYRALNETRIAISIADKAERTVSELPSISMMFHYQKAWCYFFCLEWESCATSFDKLLHPALNGNYQPFVSTTVAVASREQKDPTQASAQGLYAYQIGLCYAMMGDWHKSSWYMESIPNWLKKAGGTPKEVEKYAKRKAVEFLHRNRRATEDVLLDVLDLLHAWNGHCQMPNDALDRADFQLKAAQQQVKDGKLLWAVEEVVRWELATAVILATRGNHRGAYAHLMPVSEQQANFLKSVRGRKSGVSAFFFYELAAACLGVGDVTGAKLWHKKSTDCGDYDLFRQLAVRLHTMKQKIKTAEKNS
jgi:hypothetical protein